MARHAFPRSLQFLATLFGLAVSFAGGIVARGADAPADEARGQVIIKVVLLEIEEPILEKIKLKWNDDAEERAEGKTDVRTALVEQAVVTPLVETLQRRGAKVVSRPTLMTVFGQQVSLQSGGEIAIGENAADLADFPTRFFGTLLKATPTRLSPDRLSLKVTVDQSSLLTREDGVRGIRARTFSSEVVLKNRQAALLSTCSPEDGDWPKGPRICLVALFEVEEVAASPREVKASAAEPVKLGWTPATRAVDSPDAETPRQYHATATRQNGVGSGELAEMRSEIQELRAQIAKLTQLVSHRTQTAGAAPLRRISVDQALASEALEEATDPEEQLVTKLYSVADLVVPVADVRVVRDVRGIGESRRLKASDLFKTTEAPVPQPAPQPAPQVEFRPLVDLIAKTIEPDSWKKEGRAMVPMNANLGLVVSQTPAVHEQIAELLAQVRAMQDQMVQVQVEVVSASLEETQDVGLDLVEEGRLLSPESAERVREAFREGRGTKIMAAPRITMLNKQLCEVQTTLAQDKNLHLLLHGAIFGDGEPEGVRLNLTVNAKDAADAVRSGVSRKINSGETLVLDITDRVVADSPDRGVPMLQKIPHVERLFKNIGPDKSQRTLLLITPTVRTAEEK